VEGATIDRLLNQADPTLLPNFIKAAQKLEAEGVKAITGACGFMALFQKEIQASVGIPVFASSMMQIPFIHAMTGKRVAIITANSNCLKRKHFVACDVSDDIPVAIKGMENNAAFVSGITNCSGELDDDAVRQGAVQVALDLKNDYDDIGAILLECSDLPPYAYAIQAATGLPVFDFTTMINFVHSTLVRRPFSGSI